MLNIWLGVGIFSGNLNNCTLNGGCPVAGDSFDEMCNSDKLENLFKINAYFSLCSFIVFLLLFITDKIPRKIILSK